MKTLLSFSLSLILYIQAYTQPSYTISSDKIKPGEVWTITGKGYPANSTISLYFSKNATENDYSVRVSKDMAGQFFNNAFLTLPAFAYSDRKAASDYSIDGMSIETNGKGEFTEYIRFYPHYKFFEQNRESRQVYCHVSISKQYAPIVKSVEFVKTPWIVAAGVANGSEEQSLDNVLWTGLTLKATELFSVYTAFEGQDKQLYEINGLNRKAIESDKSFSLFNLIGGGPDAEYPLGQQTLSVTDKITRQMNGVVVTVSDEPKAVVRPTRNAIRPGDPLLVKCFNFSTFNPKSTPDVNNLKFTFSGPSALLSDTKSIGRDGTCSFLIGTAAQQNQSADKAGQFQPQFAGDKMKPGTYTISALDITSGKTITAQFTVSETAPANGGTPVANFTVSGNVAGKPISFTDASTGGATTGWQWEWNFGDTNYATEQSPKHTYTKPGEYDVSLKIYNPGFPASYARKAITVVADEPTVPAELPKPVFTTTTPGSATTTPGSSATATSADGKLSFTISTNKIKPGETWIISGKGYPANSNVSVYFTATDAVKDDGKWVVPNPSVRMFMKSVRDDSHLYLDIQINSKGEFSELVRFYPNVYFFDQNTSSRRLYCRVRVGQAYAPIILPVEFIKAPWILAWSFLSDNDEQKLYNTVWDGLTIKATEQFDVYSSFDGENNELYDITFSGRKPVNDETFCAGPGTEYPLGQQTLSVIDKITREVGAVTITVAGEPKATVKPTRSAIRPGEPLLVNCYNFSTCDANGANGKSVLNFTFSGPSKLLGFTDNSRYGLSRLRTDGTSTILIGTAEQQYELEKKDYTSRNWNVGQFVPQSAADKMKPGEYTISALDVISGKTITAKFTVSETAPASTAPTADFSASGLIAGQPTQFTDQTKGGVTNWSWDFDDHSSDATEQNPKHTFAKAGTYKVYLEVFNPGFPSSKITKSIQIQESETPSVNPPTSTTTNPTSSTATNPSGTTSTNPTTQTPAETGVSIQSPTNDQSVEADKSFVLVAQLAAGSTCTTFKVELFKKGETTSLLTPYPTVRLSLLSGLPLVLSVVPGQYVIRVSCLTQPGIVSEVAITVVKGAGRLSAGDEISYSNDFILYPNPNNGQFDLDLSKLDSTPRKISIVNEFGTIVWEKIITETCCQPVNLADQKTGVYSVIVQTDKGVVSKKVVINQ